MRKNKGLIIRLALGFVLACSGAQYAVADSPSRGAAQGRNTIGGHVFDSARRPVESVYVELLDEVDTVLRRVRTDASGRYVFSNLSDGNFQIRVLTHGTNLVGQTRRVSVTNFMGGAAGQSYEEHFTLAAGKPSGDTTAVSSSTPGVVFVQEGVPETAKAAYEKAVREIEREGGDKDSALAELKKAVEIFPTYYLALERLGTEHVRRGQFEPARAALLKAVEVNPRGYRSLYALGVAQYNLRQKAEATLSLRRSVELNPSSVNSQLWLGIVLLKDGKTAQAEPHLKRAHELGDKRVPDVHMYLAQLYSDTKRYAQAADELEHFLKDAPQARDAESIRKLIRQLREKAR